jgi:hypothetical protein
MQDKWDQAFQNPGEKVELGRDVVCDICAQDWTDRPESGGFLFGSYAYCPDCAVKGFKDIRKHKEDHRIRGFCGSESFADFVRRMRGPNAGIKVTVGAPADWFKK